MKKPISKREKTLFKAINQLLGILEDLGHDGSPPSWSKKCGKCAIIKDVKETIKKFQ